MNQIIKRDSIKHAGHKLTISTVYLITPVQGYNFVTTAHLPSASEVCTIRSATEPDARNAHAILLAKYAPKPVALGSKYAALTAMLKIAAEAARLVDLDDDGGTCNFDSMTIHLLRWNEDGVKAAAKAAGLSAWRWQGYGGVQYVIGVPVGRQGNARTRQAEAMRNSMRAHGYDTGMYYQMD